ncbi:hypothetical protein AJ80_09321 [Polytolypa hystricis UAMH7299]|uniref:Secreted protein n=1 Tax=Polytolypa hystricis (strain UAMH7299) TaxID=1447883 RepID=A0A2B7WSR9_POLH7|nr:hypothetical protein AJ80_09321 [Polytolypa hystricis UAMH7299]
MKFLSILPLIPIVSGLAVSRGNSPGGVKITEAIYAGSGCNQGTLDVNISPSGDLCPIYTKDLVARDGPNVSITETRKNCLLSLRLEYPKGWSFSVLAVDYNGYLKLGKDTTAQSGTTYYFSDEPTNVLASQVSFEGPLTGRFKRQDDLVWTTWSPCGKGESLLNINQSVLVRGTGTIAGTVTDGDLFGTTVQLKWREC